MQNASVMPSFSEDLKIGLWKVYIRWGAAKESHTPLPLTVTVTRHIQKQRKKEQRELKVFSPLVITEKLYFLHYLGSRCRFLLKVLSSFNLCHPLSTTFNATGLLSQQVYHWNMTFFFSFLRLDSVARRNFYQKSKYWTMLSFHIFYSSVTCGHVLSGISENRSQILKRKRMLVLLGPWSWHSAIAHLIR